MAEGTYTYNYYPQIKEAISQDEESGDKLYMESHYSYGEEKPITIAPENWIKPETTPKPFVLPYKQPMPNYEYKIQRLENFAWKERALQIEKGK